MEIKLNPVFVMSLSEELSPDRILLKFSENFPGLYKVPFDYILLPGYG